MMLLMCPLQLQRSQVAQVMRLANGVFAGGRGLGKPIKPECYCKEYKAATDVRNAALVAALQEARAIKCEELRQLALRQIRRICACAAGGNVRSPTNQPPCGRTQRLVQILSPLGFDWQPKRRILFLMLNMDPNMDDADMHMWTRYDLVVLRAGATHIRPYWHICGAYAGLLMAGGVLVF